MATGSSKMLLDIGGSCFCDIDVNGRNYPHVEFYVLSDLCADVILGHPFLNMHEGVYMNFGGHDPCLVVCASAMKTSNMRLFANLSEDCRPLVQVGSTLRRNFCVTKSNDYSILESFNEADPPGVLK